VMLVSAVRYYLQNNMETWIRRYGMDLPVSTLDEPEWYLEPEYHTLNWVFRHPPYEDDDMNRAGQIIWFSIEERNIY